MSTPSTAGRWYRTTSLRPRAERGRHSAANQASARPEPQAPDTGEDGAPIMSHRQILLVLLGLMAGMFLAALDQTVVGTAIRTIGDDLHGLDQQAWVTTAYLIASTIATPIYGKLSDMFGRRPLYLFGITVFIVGSLLSSFSTSMIMLAAFRAFQGIGAGALMSLPLAIMGDILAPRQRAKYQGFFLAVFGVSAVLGPLIGGLFAGADQVLWIAGWRWVFLVNVPIGIVALLMVIAFLHLPRLGTHRAPRVDWWGATAVIVTLVPLLLVAEQGREWGWGSAGAVACYVLGGVGLITFLLVERAMGDDAIIPLTLFGSHAFSMATVLGFLVGFAMFGAMLTLPLYLQIVIGLTPTASGFATLPMVLGMMIAAAGSGQLISRTGRYRAFPITGTACTSLGYLVLVFLTIDSPLWYVMIGMFLIGLGLGQLMQTLTLATQSAVSPRDMGVATSSSTFFRQIGGTMGTAVLLSVLFAVIPANINQAMGNRDDLASSLDAALTPSVAADPANAGVMSTIWNPVTGPLKDNVQAGLDQGAQRAKRAADAEVTARVTTAVQQQVDAGRLPASAATGLVDRQVAAARPAAEAQALAAAAREAQATVSDGRLVVDWADAGQRRHWVDELTPTVADRVRTNGTNAGGTSGLTSDTSFLNGADARLTRTFMTGFIDSAVTIYRVGLGVILLAFVLSWFFRPPPLRQTSALQEAADQEAADQEAADQERASAAEAAHEPAATATGSLVGSAPAVPRLTVTGPPPPGTPR